jgi:hypothetical protein
LTELAVEHWFFTPGLIMTHGGLDRDPVMLFEAAHPPGIPELQVKVLDMNRDLFRGMGRSQRIHQDVNWNRRLYMVHKDRWEACREYLLRIAFTDTLQQRYVRVCCNPLQLVDLLSLQRGSQGEFPLVPLTAFAISANDCCAYLQAASDPPRTLPTVLVQPPRNDAIIEADAVFGPPPDPQAAFRRR